MVIETAASKPFDMLLRIVSVAERHSNRVRGTRRDRNGKVTKLCCVPGRKMTFHPRNRRERV